MKMIDGVSIKKLKVIPDERGYLTEILRNDDENFMKFGQLYITAAYPGVVKGWHYHKIQYDFFAVIKGMMKIVLYDNRDNSKTKGEINEFFIGSLNPCLLKIPPYVYHGFKCISTEEAIVMNCPTELFNYDEPDEYRVDPHKNDIPYNWDRNDG